MARLNRGSASGTRAAHIARRTTAARLSLPAALIDVKFRDGRT
jgi:hypothetical protein